MTVDISLRSIRATQPPATTHRQMWALGDYAAIASEVLAPLGPILFSASGVRPGDRVLDVAAGSGNVAIAAAMAGAHVIASDLTPELLRSAQARAAAAGLELGWREANAEALPFGAGEFDAVLSAIGVMFAPRQQCAADELARVCRRRGTIGLLSWTPDGFYGRLLSAIRPYRPTLPPGMPHEVWWGNEEYVSDLFRNHVTDIQTRRDSLKVDRFSSPEACRDYFKSFYPPVINAYRNLADDPVLVTALDAVLAELCQEYLKDGVMQWEYLIFIAQKN
jgi:SAM-dependent methyltransferase